VIGEAHQQPQQKCIAALFATASLVAHTGKNSMARTSEAPFAEHYEGLGRFVERYALAEVAFHMTFRFYSKMPIAEARLFFGGSRVDDIIRHTKSLMSLHNIQKLLVDNYGDIVKHFDPIKDVRNKLVHWLLNFPEYPTPGFRMTNVAVVKRMKDMDTRTVSLAALRDMGDDLMKIWTQLTYRHIMPRPALDTSVPWRYIPPSPATKGSRRAHRQIPRIS
jgi:hypothetical protein